MDNNAYNLPSVTPIIWVLDPLDRLSYYFYFLFFYFPSPFWLIFLILSSQSSIDVFICIITFWIPKSCFWFFECSLFIAVGSCFMDVISSPISLRMLVLFFFPYISCFFWDFFFLLLFFDLCFTFKGVLLNDWLSIILFRSRAQKVDWKLCAGDWGMMYSSLHCRIFWQGCWLSALSHCQCLYF